MEGTTYTIALIDDNQDLVATLKEFLEMRGFAIVVAYDGKTGYEVVKRERPDLIVLDIMMPTMDGRDVLAKLKQDDELKRIPVVMLTAKDEQFDRDFALGEGAYEYVTKPYDSMILLRQITTILDKKKRGEL